MRIHVSELDSPKTVNVAGTEAWLTPLYEAFPLQEARLEGKLQLTLEEGGSVFVRGRLQYAPVLNCGRCEKGIPFPLELKVNTRYLPESTVPADKDLQLTEADLDAYFLDGDAVDLQGLLIDTVHLAVPSRLVLTKEDDEQTCAVCGIDLADDRLYGSPSDPTEASPFAILRDLKLTDG